MSSYSKTYASDPQLWDAGPSFLLKCQYADGTQAVVLSGWHRRAMEFENPMVLPPLDDGESYRYCSIDAETHREDPWSDIDRYELEVSLMVRTTAKSPRSSTSSWRRPSLMR